MREKNISKSVYIISRRRVIMQARNQTKSYEIELLSCRESMKYENGLK